jgi:TatD DNase family protein
MVQQDNKLRILLETDAPYMVPANIYPSLPATAKGKLPLCHSAMIPWSAEFVADCVNQVLGEGGQKWDADRVMKVAEENARIVYGV